jgi:ribosome maturation factor RimP
LSAVLDVEDPIQGAYVLEVSSPGIDRPLTRPKDFTRWSGFDARVETDRPIDGRKRFKGRLLGIDESGMIGLVTDTGEVRIPLATAKGAKLVLTDALIAAVTRAAPAEDTPEGAPPADA